MVCHNKKVKLFVIPKGSYGMSYQKGLLSVTWKGSHCHTKWVKWSVIPNGSNGLSNQMGQMVCHAYWVKWSVKPNGSNGLSYQMGQMVCHTKRVIYYACLSYQKYEMVFIPKGSDGIFHMKRNILSHQKSQMVYYTNWVLWSIITKGSYG